MVNVLNVLNVSKDASLACWALLKSDLAILFLNYLLSDVANLELERGCFFVFNPVGVSSGLNLLLRISCALAVS